MKTSRRGFLGRVVTFTVAAVTGVTTSTLPVDWVSNYFGHYRRFGPLTDELLSRMSHNMGMRHTRSKPVMNPSIIRGPTPAWLGDPNSVNNYQLARYFGNVPIRPGS